MERGFDLSNPDETAHGLHMHLHADNERDRKANSLGMHRGVYPHGVL